MPGRRIVHFEVLAEDHSAARFLEQIVPRLIGNEHTLRVIAYKGVGRIPKNLTSSGDASKRILMEQMPRLLRGYGRTYAAYPSDYRAVVVVVCDLDDRCLKAFRNELLALLDTCNPKPETKFCLAIEEIEAWLLGDTAAIKKAYPRARESVLAAYEFDSICGTWERLADAVCPGGATELANGGWHAVGAEKAAWPDKIAPHMDLDANRSPSFRYFRDKIRAVLRASRPDDPIVRERPARTHKRAAAKRGS